MKFKNFIILCGFALGSALTIQHFESDNITLDNHVLDIAEKDKTDLLNNETEIRLSESNPTLTINGLF